MTSAEWTYMFETRSGNRYLKANIAGAACVLIFPDGYAHPSGYPALTNANKKTTTCSANTFTAAQWAVMEELGVVCLPACGYRVATTVNNAGNWANYWTSTFNSGTIAYYMYFQGDQTTAASSDSPGSIGIDKNANVNYGFAVRLVRDL